MHRLTLVLRIIIWTYLGTAPRYDKTNKVACPTSEDSEWPGTLSTAPVASQADLSLYLAHIPCCLSCRVAVQLSSRSEIEIQITVLVNGFVSKFLHAACIRKSFTCLYK